MLGQGDCSRSMIRDWRCVARRGGMLHRGHRRDVGELMLKWPRSLRFIWLVLVLVLLLLLLLVLLLVVLLLLVLLLLVLLLLVLLLLVLLLLEAKGLILPEGLLGQLLILMEVKGPAPRLLLPRIILLLLLLLLPHIILLRLLLLQLLLKA